MLVDCVEDVIEDLAPQMVARRPTPVERATLTASQTPPPMGSGVVASPGAAAAAKVEMPATAGSVPLTAGAGHLSQPQVVVSMAKSADLVEEATKQVQAILNCLTDAKKLHVDAVIEICQLPSQTVLNLLLELELRGMVVQHPGKLFTLP